MARARPLTAAEKAAGGRYGRPGTTSDSPRENVKKASTKGSGDKFSAVGTASAIQRRNRLIDEAARGR